MPRSAHCSKRGRAQTRGCDLARSTRAPVRVSHGHRSDDYLATPGSPAGRTRFLMRVDGITRHVSAWIRARSLVLLALLGCVPSPPPGPTDAGGDASLADAGTTDAGGDVSLADAGTTDAGGDASQA